jgi:hypothetical protein
VQSPHAAATIDPPLRAPRPAGSAPRGEAIFAGLRDRVSAASVRSAEGAAAEVTDIRTAEAADESFLLPSIAIIPISIPPIVVAPVTVRPLTERK